MRKLLMAGAAAATLIGGTTVGVSATAQSWHMHDGGHSEGHHEFRGDHDRDDFRGFRGDRDRDDFRFRGFRDRDRFDGDDLAFGLFGFGLGATLGNSYYYDDYPGYYYGPDYDYGSYYGSCYSRRWVWSPYYGRYVLERVRYAC